MPKESRDPSPLKSQPYPGRVWVAGKFGHREAELATQPQHRLVLMQNVAEHLANAAIPGILDHPGHQRIAQAAALPVAAHQNRELRPLVVRIAVDADDRKDISVGPRGLCRYTSHHSAIALGTSVVEGGSVTVSIMYGVASVIQK